MKRLLNTTKFAFFLLLLLAVGGVVKAQTYEFAPVGAEWYYERLYLEGWTYSGVAYDRFRSLRTVEINGWECKEIELFQNLDCKGEVNPYTEIRYITQEGDQVFEVEDGQRFLLYDFGKGVGESWYAPKYGLNVYVVDTLTINLNDGSQRRILRTFLQGELEDYWYYDNIIEGIGLDKSIFPFLELDGPPPCIHEYIRCYSENGIPLFVSEAVECDYEILAVVELEGTPIASMNAVVEDAFHVEFAETANFLKQIRITDVSGRIIYNQKTMNKSLYISFSDKPAGVYFVQIVMDSKVFNNKIVKR